MSDTTPPTPIPAKKSNLDPHAARGPNLDDPRALLRWVKRALVRTARGRKDGSPKDRLLALKQLSEIAMDEIERFAPTKAGPPAKIDRLLTDDELAHFQAVEADPRQDGATKQHARHMLAENNLRRFAKGLPQV